MDKQVLKQKVTLGGISAVAGAAVWWFALAHGFGWVSANTAQQQADDASQVAVNATLAPFCADKFMSNQAALAKFEKATGYDQNVVVQDAIPKLGATAMNYQISDACVSTINARLKDAATVSLKKG